MKAFGLTDLLAQTTITMIEATASFNDKGHRSVVVGDWLSITDAVPEVGDLILDEVPGGDLFVRRVGANEACTEKMVISAMHRPC